MPTDPGKRAMREKRAMRHGENQPGRDRFTESLRQFASGLITNDQFEDAADIASGDNAARAAFWYAWHQYDDMYEHRLLGRHRLSPAQRRVFARCVLFLRSGLPYEWKRRSFFLGFARQDGPGGGGARRIRWWKPTREVFEGFRLWKGKRSASNERSADAKSQGATIIDDRIWPFRRMSDYKAALASPWMLTGVGGGGHDR